MANVEVEVEVEVQSVETPKLDAATLSALADTLKHSLVDPARIVAVISKLQTAHPDDAESVVVSTLKELGSNPALIQTVIENISSILRKKGMIDPATAVVNRLNIGENVKALVVKLAIFLFGIFCGIGIVYKSGLPIPADNVAPPANVSVYQKRIEELQTSNAELQRDNDDLRKKVTPAPEPVTPPVEPDQPPVWPPVKPPVVTPPAVVPPVVTPPAVVPPVVPGIRPGFIISAK